MLNKKENILSDKISRVIEIILITAVLLKIFEYIIL